MRYDFKILSWNINGWAAGKENLFNQIFKIEDPDVICLTETHLNSTDNLYVPNYILFENRRKTKNVNAKKFHGGVAILVKTDFRIQIVNSNIDGLLIIRLVS